MTPKILRIASASGSVTDRRHGFKELAETEDVDFIVGDWMSEYNMTTRGGAKVESNAQSSEFEPSFLESIEPALPYLDSRRIKVAVNAGASDPEKLHNYLVEKIASLGLNLKVAWIEGDEVTETVNKAIEAGADSFTSLTTGTFWAYYLSSSLLFLLNTWLNATVGEKQCADFLKREKGFRMELCADLCTMLPWRLGHS